MPIQFPIGFQPIPVAEITAQKENLRKVPSQDIPDDSPRISKPIRSKNRILEQIVHHRGLSEADRERMAYRLAPSAHAIAVPEVNGLYHPRAPSLNQLKYFYASFETEKPSIAIIRELPEEQQAFYHFRHIGKRGRDLFTDEPIEGHDSKAGTLKSSPHLNTQSQGVRAIRGEAATATINNYTNVTSQTGHFIQNLHAHVMSQLDPEFLKTGGKIHLVRPTRDHYASDATLNFFTFCTQTELAVSLNAHEAVSAKRDGRPAIEFTDYKSCIGLSRTARTEASPIGRLVQQPYFVTDDIAPGDKIVIADDHAQAGGSILAMASALKEAQAEILGVTTLTAHPYCPGFSMNEQVSAHMHNVLNEWDPEGKVLRTLSEIGLPPESLTNAEALILIAYATNPHATDNQTASIAKFRETEKYLTQGAIVMDGEHDSLNPILMQTPKSPEEIVEELKNTASETRKMVTHTPVKKVEVLDWDCLITNEKEMNYQLMVNAVFMAAHRYADTHPAIQQIAEAIKPYLNGEEYQEGMPKLLMGKEEFSKHGIANPSFWKSHVPIDLIDNLSTIAPHITLTESVKKQVISILQREFKRQYKEFTRPAIPTELAARKKEKEAVSGVDLPFKDIRLEYMPGAKEFLDQHRTPDTRLVLISNKGDNDLHNEVNKLGIAHYFDSISGVPQVTVDGKVQNLYKKPAPDRLQEALEKLSLRHRNVAIRLWGDQKQDVTQAAALRSGEFSGSIEGKIVNPANIESATEMEGIPVSYPETLQSS